MSALDTHALAQLFGAARTHNVWQDRPISDELLHALYEQVKWGPTSANCSPARFVFVKSPEAKAKLDAAMDAGNREKTFKAPVTVIVGADYAFYEKLPQLFPHQPAARSWFEGKPAAIEAAAFRNSSLQGAYLILAARALGLDCGPMSGFNQQLVNETFFAGTAIKANFLINLGYGDPAGVFPRSPRLSFDEACSVV